MGLSTVPKLFKLVMRGLGGARAKQAAAAAAKAQAAQAAQAASAAAPAAANAVTWGQRAKKLFWPTVSGLGLTYTGKEIYDGIWGGKTEEDDAISRMLWESQLKGAADEDLDLNTTKWKEENLRDMLGEFSNADGWGSNPTVDKMHEMEALNSLLQANQAHLDAMSVKEGPKSFEEIAMMLGY